MKKIEMAEEDEVDVLGDFNLNNFLEKNDSSLYGNAPLVSQNSELLNCDYTIHPQWLLDKPSANPDNWYDADLREKAQADNDTLGHVSTENCITDESGWTEKEKNLLERGIEIFGKSNIRLSQFIGSKTASEVKYYLKNFYQENQNTYNFNDAIEEVSGSNLVADVLDDTQIPASIEEVIAAVSTAKPTVSLHKRIRKKSCSFSSDVYGVNLSAIPSGQSLLKSNYLKPDSQRVKESKNKSLDLYRKRKIKAKAAKFKFRASLKMSTKENKAQVKQKIVKVMNQKSQKTEFSKVEITTGKGLAVPICEGEEIVRIKKADDDSDLDVEIDVEDSDDDMGTNTFNLPEKISKPDVVQTRNDDEDPKRSNVDRIEGETMRPVFDLSTLDKSTVEELQSLEVPKSEVVLSEYDVTELEKVIHCEFFERRSSTKTPMRYLKIRNHIINTWIAQKPVYVTKTSIRQGLKNCGDVNSIGRIHYFLEQIGAINFGCAQMTYVRPLYDMVQMSAVVREKPTKHIKGQPRPANEFSSIPRNKKKFINDGEGGLTLTHDERGYVINTIVVNKEPPPKQRPYIKKPTVRLIYCRPFTEENPQPYTIRIHLSALLTMDFHAHISLTEVMGLVAGYWIPQSKTLTLSHYEPCLNIASSATHCDMCPISQAKAADVIHSKGLDILGWFHSHPTFAPEPSHQDIETQQTLQQWIGYNKPCIGVILSPFSLSGALIASPFRCMAVGKKLNFEDQMVPYKFKVELITDGFVVGEFLKDIRAVFKASLDGGEASRVKFNRPYFLDSGISHLEKYITSVRMHLAKCGTLNKTTCDAIIEGITQIVTESRVV